MHVVVGCKISEWCGLHAITGVDDGGGVTIFFMSLLLKLMTFIVCKTLKKTADQAPHSRAVPLETCQRSFKERSEVQFGKHCMHIYMQVSTHGKHHTP